MADPRKPLATLYVKRQGEKTKKIELFDAESWDEVYEGGLYRLRLNRKWIGERYDQQSFFTVKRVAELVSGYLVHDAKTQYDVIDTNLYSKGKPIRVELGLNGAQVRTRIDSEEPFLGYDGRWYIGCSMPGRGHTMVPIAQVTLV